MRILDKYHDYYDSVQGLGTDQETIYKRRQDAYARHVADFPSPLLDKDRYGWRRRPWRADYATFGEIYEFRDRFSGVLHQAFVLFAGKAYAGFQWDWTGRDGYSHTDWIWNPLTFLTAWNNRVGKRRPFKDTQSLAAYFRQPEHDERARTFLEAHGAAIAVHRFRNLNRKRTEAEWWELDPPILKDIEFYKAVPTAAAYQELQMWVSNQARPDRPMVKLSDKELIVKHGMDLKTSFRHPVK
jgi:hypothetical protein